MKQIIIRDNLITNLYQFDLLKDNFLISIEKSEDFDTFTDLVAKLDSIDSFIKKHLYEFDLHRISFLDRAIIRLATYDLMYTTKEKGFIITEALELTKEYSDIDDKQRKFNHRLLDNIAASVSRGKKDE
ncbi:MAG: transcription antitermination protein NusB [Acholeplasmatales bacterium]|jgi:N utilization substance protein B|nr:transcription antitermination protein NusB [Acholeplasmatales bacterium]